MISVISSIDGSITFQGLRYLWDENKFLRRSEVDYAMERLWYLIAGDAIWESESGVYISAVDLQNVERMLKRKEGELESIFLPDILPSGVQLGLDTEHLPALCMCHGNLFEQNACSIKLDCDLIAATFLLLSRWEENEYGTIKDSWGNSIEAKLFPARQGFLDRPVLDEWALVISSWLRSFCPQWKPCHPKFYIRPTHDIDHLFRYPRLSVMPRRLIGSAIRTRSVKSVMKVASEGWMSLAKPSVDPGVKIIHDMAERNKLRGFEGVFFFMSSLPGPFDDGYRIYKDFHYQIVADLVDRGQIVGWHPGYNAAENFQRFLKEMNNIEIIAAGASCFTRFHYLRWRDTSVDWLEMIGAKYDFTWGMNDQVGFSHGTCHPFPLWNRVKQKKTSIIETPLVVQDGPLVRMIDQDLDQGRKILKKLIARSHRVSGCFTFLLHNNPNCGPFEYSKISDLFYNCLPVD